MQSAAAASAQTECVIQLPSLAAMLSALTPNIKTNPVATGHAVERTDDAVSLRSGPYQNRTGATATASSIPAVAKTAHVSIGSHTGAATNGASDTGIKGAVDRTTTPPPLPLGFARSDHATLCTAASPARK